MKDNLVQVFLEEASELLTDIEEALLELEENPDDPDLMGRIFRDLHTIKGSGAMFGFENIAEFTHEIETFFTLVRDGKVKVCGDIIGLILNSRDQIRHMLENGDKLDNDNREINKDIINSLKTFLPEFSKVEKESTEGKVSVDNPESLEDKLTYRILFEPNQDIFLSGTKPLMLIEELNELGYCHTKIKRKNLPKFEVIDPEKCYLKWDIILTTAASINEIKDVFIFVEDECDIKIDIIDTGSADYSDEEYMRLGEILIERGKLDPTLLQEILITKPKTGELLEKSGVSKDDIDSALIEQKHVREVRKKRQAISSSKSIRVASDKLDSLFDLVGELVTMQARLSQIAVQKNDSELETLAEQSESLIWELRDKTMSIRMLPIGTTFSKFKRLVRDLSTDLGKEIELTTEGAETELDKTVIEKLNDPLVHIIRNSIDHGIERPKERVSLGKPETGSIHLEAIHSGTNVLIKITDDGQGLDKERVLAKAMERGLIAPDAKPTDKEIYQMLFMPGFSTAKEITNVSGRGVGMDVVKKNIEALKGEIDIDSMKGQGTTITLKLPLTLAIIDGLLVTIGEDYFVMPLSLIEESIELQTSYINNSQGRNLANVRGELVPYILLRELFDLKYEPGEIQQAVIARHEENRIGFVVDKVIGGHQTVIKSLGRYYKDVMGVSGATILGDGTIALILDLPRIMEHFMKSEINTNKS